MISSPDVPTLQHGCMGCCTIIVLITCICCHFGFHILVTLFPFFSNGIAFNTVEAIVMNLKHILIRNYALGL